MKNILVLVALVTGLIFEGCSDDETKYVCSSCVDSPEALAANNNSGKGIYKGVVLGSTGTIKFNIANSDNTISGVLVLDGKTYQLLPWNNDGIYNLGYHGYLGGKMFVDNDIIIDFTVNSTGTTFSAVSLTIPTHPDVIIEIEKELSTGLLEVFQGTFSGDADGVFNLLVVRGETGDGSWYAVSKDTEDYVGYYEGEIDQNIMTGNGADVEVQGEISGDNVSGDWDDPVEDSSGSWRGKRTL